jgi:hypothetical protein
MSSDTVVYSRQFERAQYPINDEFLMPPLPENYDVHCLYTCIFFCHTNETFRHANDTFRHAIRFSIFQFCQLRPSFGELS